MRNPKRLSALPVLILTLIAFALAIYGLDGQSLRGDEAFDAVFITQPVSAWLGELRTSQPYPPLYHLLLTAWAGVAGNSVFALRFVSALSAVLVVPLTYRLGQLWFGSAAGRWAALLVTFQPLVLWYAQDRLYAPLLALALASTVCAVALWQGQHGTRLWIGYVTLTLLSLGVHYVALFLVIAHNLIALVLGLRRRGTRGGLSWLSAQGLIGLAYLPWVAFAWPVLTAHTSSWIQPATLPDMIVRLFRAYSVGLTITPAQAIIPLVGFALAATIAWVGPTETPARLNRGVVALLILVPIACVWIVSRSRPMFDERYLVFLIAPYLALVAYGLSRVPRRGARAALVAILLAGMSIATLNYRFDRRFAKAPDWNATFAFLQEHARPTDAVIYTYPDPAPEYYAQGRWSIVLLPAQVPPDRETLTRRATEIVAAHPRIWLIPQWSPAWDDQRLTEQVLDSLAERAAELKAGPFHLVLYHTPALYETEQTPLDARLGQYIHLIGAVVRATDGSPTTALVIRPGDSVRVTLYWRAEQTPETEYSVFVHLLDGTGRSWSQQDNWPRGGAYPTSWWQPGATVVDTYVLAVPPDAPSGTYTLITGMHSADGTQLPTTGTHADTTHARIALPMTIQIQIP